MKQRVLRKLKKKVVKDIAKHYGLKDEPLSNYPKATFNASPDR